MSFKISVLASGSTGNAIYIESDSTRLLLDSGLSLKKLEEALSEIGRLASQLDAVLISHEHGDHILGVGVLHRKHKTPIYGNEATLTCAEFNKKVGKLADDALHFIDHDESVVIGDIEVNAFGTSHDSAKAQFYTFEHDGKKIACVTDTGYVSEKIEQVIKSSNVFLIESNHDVEMLLAGERPWSNKQRVLSDRGHLSNEDSAIVTARVIDENTHSVILAHLSRDNNLEDLALMNMNSYLADNRGDVFDNLQIIAAKPNAVTDLIEV
ncbi:MAG: MBL fold metallo-hydrolase [Lactobacillales bacterium]|jgi:phosphoribosyl 1,2-cyclic phosphodiesterase|nr:MBL fold metallo-hydrolase [Lactobacillales bacterium]